MRVLCVRALRLQLDGPLPDALAADVESLAAAARDAVEDAVDAVVNGSDAAAALDDGRRVAEDCRELERSLPDAHPEVAYPAGRVVDRVALTAADAADVARLAVQGRL